MAHVRVFVDDLVLGDLPMVCARTGAPADGKAPVSGGVGGLSGWAILLVFLGPVGWGLLAILALTGGTGETVRGWVPMTEEAFERVKSARRSARVGMVVAAAGVVALVVSGSSGVSPVPALIVIVGGIVAAAVASIVADRVGVSVSLDGSRRWVTLDRVHPAFVTATEARQRLQRASQA